MSQASRSVHIFGPSTLVSSDLGEGRSLLTLTRRALERAHPDIAWQCEASVLYIAPGMTERLVKTLERRRPDIVVLRLPQNQFMSDYLVYRVRELWPGGFGLAVKVAGWLLGVAGGGPEGARSARGWLFRVPRSVVARLVGVAPAVRVEDAVRLVRDSIDAILRFEDVQLLYLMPTQTVPPNVSAEKAEERKRYFVNQVAAHCQQRDVPWLDPVAVLANAGIARQLGADRWHTDLRSREFDAQLLSQAIIQALDGKRELQFAF